MYKHVIIIALSTLFFIPTSFAATTYVGNISNKQCDLIADSCKSAGFTNEGMGEKSFWFDCMKPIIYGKTVEGVTISSKDAKECRKAKIADLKQELKELQAVK